MQEKLRKPSQTKRSLLAPEPATSVHHIAVLGEGLGGEIAEWVRDEDGYLRVAEGEPVYQFGVQEGEDVFGGVGGAGSTAL